MEILRKQGGNSGGESDADKREEVCGGDGSAFVLLLGPMLDEGVNGNDEKTAREAQGSQQNENLLESKIGQGQKRAEYRHPHRTEGNQAVLDVVSGKIAGGKTADADPDGDRGLQVSAAAAGNVEDALTVEHDVELEQSAEKPEVGVTDNGEPKSAVPARAREVRRKIAEQIKTKNFTRIGGGNARDEAGGKQAKERTGQEKKAAICLMSGEELGQTGTGDGSGDNRKERAQLNDAVAPGQVRFGEQFREKTVFGGAEDCRLRAGEKHRGKKKRDRGGRGDI